MQPTPSSIVLLFGITLAACRSDPGEPVETGTIPTDTGPSPETGTDPTTPPVVDGAPFLAFSDLVVGPRVGNSDDSQPGQTAGEDGAIVTVWGKALGTTPGTVRVGGVTARIYGWELATAPADLASHHRMQLVAFQIPHDAPLGPTTIAVEVDGAASNVLPFTVTDSGSIYFVRVGGDDADDGSYARPWASLSHATSTIDRGDIVYAGDGVAQTAAEGDRSTLDLDRDPGDLGTAAAPKAIVGYPGATASIGTEDLNAWSTFVSGSPSPSTWWTVAKMHLTGRHLAASYHTGFRLVGNRIRAPRGDDQTGAIGGIDSSDLYVLGNELTDCGYAGTSKLYHPMYIQSPESSEPPRLPDSDNREIAWNYLHDNYAYDGINFYREGQYSSYMTNTRVHDNVVIRQTGRGMLIGTYLTGEDNYFYNNIIIEAGQGPEPAGPFATDPAFGYVCVDINSGAVGAPPTTIHFYNNTLVNCGFGGGPSSTDGQISVGNAYPFDLDFRNNIIVSDGFPFLQAYTDTSRTTAARNLWFGDGGAVPDPYHPEIFADPVVGDPLFVDLGADDVRLAPGSPAIDQGSDLAPVPAVDFDHRPRPTGPGYDVGAFEAPAAGG